MTTKNLKVSDGARFHADSKKGLKHEFREDFPLILTAPKGEWQVDALAEHAPWRLTVLADDAITFCRLAVHRGWRAATTAKSRQRRKCNARTDFRKGYLDARGNPIRTLRAAAAEPGRPLNGSEKFAWQWACSLADRLGIYFPPAIAENGTCPNLAAWLKTADVNLHSGPGRTSTADLNVFFQSLVCFWDRNMKTQAPSSRRLDPKRRRDRVSFHDFASAAAKDAGYNTIDISDRAICRAVVAVRRGKKVDLNPINCSRIKAESVASDDRGRTIAPNLFTNEHVIVILYDQESDAVACDDGLVISFTNARSS